MSVIETTLLSRPPAIHSFASTWLSPAREENFALPTVSNFHGYLQVAWGPSGIQNWVVPPSGYPTPTGILYRLDGTVPTRVEPEGTRYRWFPWKVERSHPVVDTTTIFHASDSAVTEQLTFRESGRFGLVFGGLARTWSFTDYWNLPPEDVPQLNISWDGEAVLVSDTKTFGVARVFPHVAPSAVRAYRRMDSFLSGSPADKRGRFVVLEFEVADGDEVSWTAVQGAASTVTPRTIPSSGQSQWSEVWDAAFTANNAHFSGHLPALDFGDERLNRLYYMSVLSCLMSRRLAPELSDRSRFATGGQAIWSGEIQALSRAYTWGGSEGAPTTSFLWEVQLQAALLARLDPDILRTQLEGFFRADMGAHWGIDVLTGRGVGMRYGVNDGAIITACADYLRITKDVAWLDSLVGANTVREHLLRHLGQFEKLAAGQSLSDFGHSENILECVSTYEHRIASFNAMAAWCYRFAAANLDPERAPEYLHRAEKIETAVHDLLHPDGYFMCDTPTGRRPVRTCLDFIYVGRFMADYLSDHDKSAMLQFFTRELETADWMRALSLHDGDAFTTKLPYFQTYRADHQACGSYDGWPGWSAQVRLRFGDTQATLEWLRRISETTWEGPFGQAHWTGITEAEGQQAATKSSFFNGNCYLEACGVTLATTLLEEIAGL
ncbi:MAG: hypothetical protein B5766_09670 [Candidatus Lumbricidophila eiseniae]|uniref:Uncharacterized protein n=1 Tax=Candidatus Lumbricidiphila eiseniae TaxID=1969409 RepID=A0A2A6FPB2_9MICO|nr:MAG: hypothetical protein B5766_09670 [Candidatus Lumbricidophila eiseniae]